MRRGTGSRASSAAGKVIVQWSETGEMGSLMTGALERCHGAALRRDPPHRSGVFRRPVAASFVARSRRSTAPARWPNKFNHARRSFRFHSIPAQNAQSPTVNAGQASSESSSRMDREWGRNNDPPGRRLTAAGRIRVGDEVRAGTHPRPRELAGLASVRAVMSLSPWRSTGGNRVSGDHRPGDCRTGGDVTPNGVTVNRAPERFFLRTAIYYEARTERGRRRNSGSTSNAAKNRSMTSEPGFFRPLR